MRNAATLIAAILLSIANLAIAQTIGKADAYVLASTSGNAPVTGQVVEFWPGRANTGPATAAYGGGSALAVVSHNGAALVGGEISEPTWLQYTGKAWQIVGTGPAPDRVRTAAEIAADEMPTSFACLPGDPRRWGAVGGAAGSIPSTDDSKPWALDVDTGYVNLPAGWAFEIVTGAKHTGQLILVGAGMSSQLYSDGAVVTVSRGTGSIIDNLWAANITAPYGSWLRTDHQ